VYIPPYYDMEAVSYMQLLTDCLSHYTSNKCVHVVVSDFNLPRVNWDMLTGPDDVLYQSFVDFVANQGLSQLINFPTRGPNVLTFCLLMLFILLLVFSAFLHLEVVTIL